jgi:group I intron endonuclease
MSSIYSIYKATNTINGKIYIGFDSNWPNRQKGHKYSLNTRNQKFYLALRKYGWNNFIWEVIYQSKDGIHCLQKMEPYFINEYNSFECGYNLTLGGEGSLGRKTKETTKIKISQKIKGRYTGKNNPMYDRKHSLESKLKMSRPGKKPKLQKSLSKGIYFTPWGNFISTTLAAEHPDSFIKYYGTIRDFCLNNQKPRKKYLKGKTAKESGFYFIPNESSS